MELKQLLYFKTIVEEGNILKASKKLFMSQPPLTKQMQLLEEELKCTLFERGTRKIILTPEGELLYERAKVLLELSNTTKKEIENIKNDETGNIRIGIVSSISDFGLNKYLIPFHQKYPLVHFELSEANTYQLIEKIENNILDIAIVRTPFKDANMKHIPLLHEKLILLGDESYLQNIDSFKDLDQKPLIMYRRWANILQLEFKKYNITPNIICLNDDARTTMAWVNNKMGLAIVPESASLLMNENCIKKELPDVNIVSDVLIIYKENSYLSNITKKFLDEITTL